MPPDRDELAECFKCQGRGAYCWTCGEVEPACICEDGEGNIGVCDECESAEVGEREDPPTGCQEGSAAAPGVAGSSPALGSIRDELAEIREACERDLQEHADFPGYPEAAEKARYARVLLAVLDKDLGPEYDRELSNHSSDERWLHGAGCALSGIEDVMRRAWAEQAPRDGA